MYPRILGGLLFGGPSMLQGVVREESTREPRCVCIVGGELRTLAMSPFLPAHMPDTSPVARPPRDHLAEERAGLNEGNDLISLP